MNKVIMCVFSCYAISIFSVKTPEERRAYNRQYYHSHKFTKITLDASAQEQLDQLHNHVLATPEYQALQLARRACHAAHQEQIYMHGIAQGLCSAHLTNDRKLYFRLYYQLCKEEQLALQRTPAYKNYLAYKQEVSSRKQCALQLLALQDDPNYSPSQYHTAQQSQAPQDTQHKKRKYTRKPTTTLSYISFDQDAQKSL